MLRCTDSMNSKQKPINDACEYCGGTVLERIVEREVFRHKNGLGIQENVPIGVCEKCGEHYYSAGVLHKVHAIATGRAKPSRSELVPIAKYA